MIVLRAHSLSCVEIIFRKGKTAGRYRSPRVDETKQDDIELPIAATDEVAAFAENSFHVRPIIEVAGAGAVAAHKLQHKRIHLDSGDFLASRRECSYDVRPTAWSDNQRFGIGRQTKWKRPVRAFHVRHALNSSVPIMNSRPRIRIDIEPRKTIRQAFDTVDARVGVPTRLHDMRARSRIHLIAHGLSSAGFYTEGPELHRGKRGGRSYHHSDYGDHGGYPGHGRDLVRTACG